MPDSKGNLGGVGPVHHRRDGQAQGFDVDGGRGAHGGAECTRRPAGSPNRLPRPFSRARYRGIAATVGRMCSISMRAVRRCGWRTS